MPQAGLTLIPEYRVLAACHLEIKGQDLNEFFKK
jgi:cytoplasmic iron level regulating protein YaaA (DUF328/UPF0246 family)